MVPAWNTVAQTEFDGMCPVGVTNHISRVPIHADPGDPAFAAAVESGLEATIPHVSSPAPGRIVIAIDHAVSAAATNRIAAAADAPCITRDEAIAAALEAVGAPQRVAVLFPACTAEGAGGLELPADARLVRSACWPGGANPVEAARLTEAELRAALLAIDGDDIDAILCLGDNVPVARLAGEAENWLGKPVLAANTACYWHALRAHGIPDKVAGYGCLLERH